MTSKNAGTSALYNEIEPYAAAWLSNLVAAGHIAPGAVDARSIRDLTASDVSGNGQRHFFAGIGVWSHALRLAGWPDDVGDAGLARSGWYTRAIPGTQTEGNQERQLVGRVLDVAVPPGPTRGFWSPADWIACRDGKVRPVEPGAFPLAHGATARVGRVRAYGNAIVPQVAATFIQAVMEALTC